MKIYNTSITGFFDKNKRLDKENTFFQDQLYVSNSLSECANQLQENRMGCKKTLQPILYQVIPEGIEPSTD